MHHGDANKSNNVPSPSLFLHHFSMDMTGILNAIVSLSVTHFRKESCMQYPPNDYHTGPKPPYYQPTQPPNTQYPPQQFNTGYPSIPPGHPSQYPPQQPYYAQQFPPQQVMFPVGPGMTCPYCRYTGPARSVHKVSTGGWVCFVVLLFVFFPLCWIGLLMKTHGYSCGRCGIALGDRP